MIVLEMPETTKDINILGKVYKLDITDFTVLREIADTPSLNTNSVPEKGQMSIYLEQYQELFKKVLGEELVLSQDKLELKYFFARSILVKLYNVILEEQNKYLNIEYPRYDVDKMLELTRNMAKIKDIKEGESDNK